MATETIETVSFTFPNTLPTSTPEPTVSSEDEYVRRPTKPLPRYLIEGARIDDPHPWDASKHFHHVSPAKVHTMEEFGLGGRGISPVAISEPFPLFTTEAVRQMRAELFSERVLSKHQYKSSFASNMIRGECPESAPFVTDAWYDPSVLAAISKIAGLELVPLWDHDIANINISTPSDAEKEQLQNDPAALEERVRTQEQEMSAFGWHFDSVPFVCVTMLSDCTGMVGGETMIRLGTGEKMKMRGPTMGTAVLMQGRYIEHQALKALGGERISMVTAFRPKNALIKDEAVLTGVRGISDLPELYYQYSKYRYEVLEERMRDQARKITKRHERKREFELESARAFLTEQRAYIDKMLEELIEVK